MGTIQDVIHQITIHLGIGDIADVILKRMLA